MQKTWGGRFTQDTNALVEAFTASIGVDQTLYAWDILGSQAHARMLAACGVLTTSENDAIQQGLTEIKLELEAGTFEFSVSLEDIHTHVERRLIEKIGDAGKKLHTARSRNDQVVLDFRLYLRHETDTILDLIREFQGILVQMAEQHQNTLFPGYTHLQRAQPIVFAHHLLAYYEMLQRDWERLTECRRRINVLPLGAAALAGTSYPIDREMVARDLNFERVAANSLDAVSDRDFAIEFCADAALLMMHVGRFCQELTLWSSTEFGFIEISDGFCTGSSIMPQKKNPDVAELVRGKSGRVYGALMALLTIMKALPLTYNTDMQEDKAQVFDVVQTVQTCLRVMIMMLPETRVHAERIAAGLDAGFLTATEVADYLVRRGLSFRTAHEMVGAIVRYCIETGKTLQALTLAEFQQFAPQCESDVLQIVEPRHAVNSKTSLGGTAVPNVLAAIQQAKVALGREGALRDDT